MKRIPQLGLTILLCNFVFGALPLASQSLRISELLAINERGLVDEDGDHSDWIEIKNIGSATVNLELFFLTDDADESTKWRIPGADLAPGERRIVFASGKNRQQVESEWHTNFKLAGGGESIFLFATNGFTIDQLSYPAQIEDKSFGYPSDDFTKEAGFLLDATPGSVNSEIDGSVGLVPPIFSVERSIRSDPFILYLTQEADFPIRFTLDGSRPSRSHGEMYTDGISVNTTSIVRAMAFNIGGQTNVATHSFVFLEDVVNQSFAPSSYPSIWRSTTPGIGDIPADYGMDDASFWGGQDRVRGSLESLPSISIVMHPDSVFGPFGWFNNGGKGNNGLFEKGASIEWMYTDGRKAIQVDGGVQGRSHAADRNRKRGITLKFKSEYGPSKLEHDVFADAPLHSEIRVQEFDRIMIRSGMLDTYTGFGFQAEAAFIRDPVFRDAQLAVSGYGTMSTWAHIYINGLYWGLYAIAERIDQAMLSEKYGGNSEDWMTVKRNLRGNDMGRDEVDGDRQIYDDLVSLILSSNEDFSIPALYADACRLVDPSEFADYIILASYHAIGDWPIRNWYFVAQTNPSESGRFFGWDSEVTWLYRRPLYQEALYTPDSEEGGQTLVARLWRSMIKNAEFRLLFRDRIFALLFDNGALTPERSLERWNAHAGHVQEAIVAEQARWADMRLPRESIEDWELNIQAVRNQLPDVRQDFLLAFTEPHLSIQMWDEWWPPSFNKVGGEVYSGFELILRNDLNDDAGQIVYTTDGSDPRGEDGLLSSSAKVVERAALIRLMDNVTVSARVIIEEGDGYRWSPLRRQDYIAVDISSTLILEPPYPNPARGSASLRFSLPESSDVTIELFDIAGRKTSVQSQGQYSEGYHVQSLNLEDLSSGLYLILLTSSSGRVSSRLTHLR